MNYLEDLIKIRDEDNKERELSKEQRKTLDRIIELMENYKDEELFELLKLLRKVKEW